MAKNLDEKYIDKQKRSKEYHEESKNWMRNAEMREKVQKTSRKGKKRAGRFDKIYVALSRILPVFPLEKVRKSYMRPFVHRKMIVVTINLCYNLNSI